MPQTEANALLAMEKSKVDDQEHDFPSFGGSLRIPIKPKQPRGSNPEEFSLDVTRGKIELKKTSTQNRVMQTVILVRLDLGGPPHRNPDDVEIQCPHLHIYRQGYADKWAFEVPKEHFRDLADCRKTLEDFMKFCNITDQPLIRHGLFS